MGINQPWPWSKDAALKRKRLADNVITRRDWLVGVPMLFCALTLPFSEGLPFRDDGVCFLIAFYGFFLALTAFYRPTAQFFLLLFAFFLNVPDAFRVPVPLSGADWVLRGWRWCWVGLAIAVWLRWYLARREDKQVQTAALGQTAPGRSGAGPRLSRPIQIIGQIIVSGGVGLVLLTGLYRAYQNAALVEAINHNDVATVRVWLRRSANPNCLGLYRGECYRGECYDDWDYIGCSSPSPALKLAIWKKQPEIMADLLAHGADVNKRFSNGNTALMEAAEDDLPKVMRVLLEHGVNVNAREAKIGEAELWNRTALFFSKNVEIAQELLAHGADVHARSSDGSTVLHMRLEDADIVQALLRAGADPLAKDNAGKTAHNIAAQKLRDAYTALKDRDDEEKENRRLLQTDPDERKRYAENRASDLEDIHKYKRVTELLKRAEENPHPQPLSLKSQGEER